MIPKCIPLTILGFVIGVIAAALIVGALTTPTSQHRDIGPATPIVTASPLDEDDPDWDCFEDGNRICGDTTRMFESDGWAQWDIQNGAKSLRVDPSREYRVMYVGIAKVAPKLACNEIALPSLTYWYVFRATYMDGNAVCK